MRKISITVGENGQTSTDYINFVGAECLSESQRFHTLLAQQFGVHVETTGNVPKPELLAALSPEHQQIPVQEQNLDGRMEE